MTSLAGLYPSVSVTGFRILWLGMLPSLVAFQIGVVATGYAAVTLSDSVLAVGLVSGAWGLPVLLLPIVGGVAADRYPRRLILLATHAVICAAWAVIGVLAFEGRLAIWHLVVLGLIQGISFSFMTPARIAYTAAAVGPDLLQNAVAAFYASMNVAIIAGPVIGGLILSISGVGLAWAYVVAAGLYGIAAAILFRLPDMPTAGDARMGARTQLARGLAYIRSTPPIPRLITLAAAATLFGVPYVQLMPVFADRVFSVGAAGLGLLLAAGGVGALAGSVAAARIRRRDLDLWQRALGICLGVLLMAFGFSPSFLIAFAIALAAGLVTAAFAITNNSLVMMAAAPQFYGRVMSVYQLTFGLGPLAAVPMAWLADQIGAPAAIALGGVLLAVATVLLAGRRIGVVNP